MGNENSPSLSNTQKRTLKLQVLISIVKRTLRKYRSGLSVSTCLGGTNKKIPTRGRERDDKKGDKWRHREHTKFKRAPFHSPPSPAGLLRDGRNLRQASTGDVWVVGTLHLRSSL